MLRTALLVSLLAVAGAAPAQTDFSNAERVEVSLASFSFTPKSIHLHAGTPTVLHLVNTAGGGHSFSAPQFFAAASLDPTARAAVGSGSIELSGHQSLDIALVPKAGHYDLKCTHPLHKAFGMSGEIVVD